MRDLEADNDQIRTWFGEDDGDDDDDDDGVLIVRTSEDAATSWLAELAKCTRRCYVSDEFLESRAKEINVDKADLVAALIPDPGSVMAGDFGEVLAFLFLAAREHPTDVVGPKKWRLKQDRLKAAPYSDVVQFIVPKWPQASADDRLLCAEVKTKSTDGGSTPIESAIADSEKDRVGRLAKTLAWLNERALIEDLGTTSIPLIQRFLNATDHPPAAKQFWAVAVVCTSLVDAELAGMPEEIPNGCRVAVIAVPELKARYTEVFAAVRDSVAE